MFRSGVMVSLAVESKMDVTLFVSFLFSFSSMVTSHFCLSQKTYIAYVLLQDFGQLDAYYHMEYY